MMIPLFALHFQQPPASHQDIFKKAKLTSGHSLCPLTAGRKALRLRE